jgi:hypothetical protein
VEEGGPVQPDRKRRLFGSLFPLPNRWRNALYLHVPFCLQRCHFCVYFSKVPDSRRELVTFASDHLGREIDAYAPVLSEVRFSEVYLGGGTPTILAADTLNHVFGRIPHFRDIAFKGSEASPRTLKDEHVSVFRDWGFRYVSIGVQTFDRETLRRQNREDTDVERLAGLIASLQAADIVVNVDLILFLQSGTLADLEQGAADLCAAMRLDPDSITVHCDYNAAKTLDKQRAVVALLRQELERSTRYVCTNSWLRDEDLEAELRGAAEYRLMRNDRRTFTFSLLAKIPQAIRFGYNVLGLGEYEYFKLRSNYFWVSDFYPPHAHAAVMAASRAVEQELATVRRGLDIPHPAPAELDHFFEDDAAQAAFIDVMRAEGYPGGIMG